MKWYVVHQEKKMPCPQCHSPSPPPPSIFFPFRRFHWRDRCSYARCIVKKTVHCLHAVTRARQTMYNTHTHTSMYKHPPSLLAGHCLVRVCAGGYSGTQGNGTWGYSGLNGSSGYTAAHKVPVWAPPRLMRLCTQCLAQLQRTGVCLSLNCPPVVWASPSGRPCPLAAI